MHEQASPGLEQYWPLGGRWPPRSGPTERGGAGSEVCGDDEGA